MKKKEVAQVPLMPVAEHQREIEKSNASISELQQNLKTLKKDSLAMAADYRKRLELREATIAQLNAAMAQALEAADLMRKKLEEKLRSHNEKNGEVIKKLREENEKLARLLSDADTALPPEATPVVETPSETSIDDTSH